MTGPPVTGHVMCAAPRFGDEPNVHIRQTVNSIVSKFNPFIKLSVPAFEVYFASGGLEFDDFSFAPETKC